MCASFYCLICCCVCLSFCCNLCLKYNNGSKLIGKGELNHGKTNGKQPIQHCKDKTTHNVQVKQYTKAEGTNSSNKRELKEGQNDNVIILNATNPVTVITAVFHNVAVGLVLTLTTYDLVFDAAVTNLIIVAVEPNSLIKLRWANDKKSNVLNTWSKATDKSTEERLKKPANNASNKLWI